MARSWRIFLQPRSCGACNSAETCVWTLYEGCRSSQGLPTMLRHLSGRLLQHGLRRGISTSSAALEEGLAAPAGPKEFIEAWHKAAPSTMNVPELPSSFLVPEKEGEPSTDGERFPVNFYTPHGVVAENKVIPRSGDRSCARRGHPLTPCMVAARNPYTMHSRVAAPCRAGAPIGPIMHVHAAGAATAPNAARPPQNLTHARTRPLIHSPRSLSRSLCQVWRAISASRLRTCPPLHSSSQAWWSCMMAQRCQSSSSAEALPLCTQTA